jgi:hypothetical protein
MAQVLVAYADGDADVGARVAAALADAGVEATTHAGPPNLKSEKDRFDAASAVVLVWSRNTAAEAALRREAMVAASRGKLVIARADAGQPPPALRTARSWAVTRANAVLGARRLARALANAPAPTAGRKPAMNATMPEDTTNYGSTWKGTILITLLIAAVAYGAAVAAFGPSPQTAILALLKGG